MKNILLLISLLFLSIYLFVSKPNDTIHIITWSDLFTKDILEKFEKETKIKVIVDYIDDEEALESRKLDGYDLVTATATPYVARLVKKGMIKEIDTNKLKNYKNIDQKILDKFNSYKLINKFALPFFYGTFVIVYNEKYLKKLGIDIEINSYDVIFNEEIIKKISPYGICITDDFMNLFSIVLGYLGYDYNTEDIDELCEAYKLLYKIRPYVKNFSSMRFINDLLINEIVIAIASTHETYKVLSKSDSMKYVHSPNEKLIWFDCLVLPRKSNEIVYKFIDFLLEEENSILLTKKTFLANSVSHKYRKNKDMPNHIFIDNITDYYMRYPKDKKANDFIFAAWKSILQKVPIQL